MPENLSLPREQESPRHGYRGERRASDHPFLPASLTVAMSREAGSRGTSVAKRAAARLGWQLYTQEMLEFVAQDPTGRQEIADNLSPAAQHWVEEQMEPLLAEADIQRDQAQRDMARLILSLGATGEVILIGRGAGYLLPRHSTLHVRVVAPLADRVAYMSEWLRLTLDEAAKQVRLRDKRRADYMEKHFQRDVTDVYQYDLLLNSSLLGEELSAELLAQAARAKVASLLASHV